MALIDLTHLDLLDLTLAHALSEEEQYEVLDVYMQGFSQFLSEAFHDEFNENDDEEMKKLMADGSVTPDKLMDFYSNKVPHLDAKLMQLALMYKKNFIQLVYQKKLEEYNSQDDQYGKEAWLQVVNDAKNDNWNEVARLIKVIATMKSSPFTPVSTH